MTKGSPASKQRRKGPLLKGNMNTFFSLADLRPGYAVISIQVKHFKSMSIQHTHWLIDKSGGHSPLEKKKKVIKQFKMTYIRGQVCKADNVKLPTMILFLCVHEFVFRSEVMSKVVSFCSCSDLLSHS